LKERKTGRKEEGYTCSRREKIKEAITGGRPETIQEVGGRRGYKSRENQGGHQRGGPRQYKRWEVEAVIKVEKNQGGHQRGEAPDNTGGR
jgi:hypothetical protein